MNQALPNHLCVVVSCTQCLGNKLFPFNKIDDYFNCILATITMVMYKFVLPFKSKSNWGCLTMNSLDWKTKIPLQ
jgi:hypothetical protein